MTLRCGSIANEIPLAMKPGRHGNQADDVFLSFSKNIGLQSFHKPRECQTAMVILFILVSPPAVLTRGSSLPAPWSHQLFAVLPLHLCRWHTHVHWFLCLMHPSIHQTMLFWWYGFTSNGQTPGGGVEVVHFAPFFVANPHESLLPCGRSGLGASEPYEMPMFDSSLTFAKRHAHKIARS